MMESLELSPNTSPNSPAWLKLTVFKTLSSSLRELLEPFFFKLGANCKWLSLSLSLFLISSSNKSEAMYNAFSSCTSFLDLIFNKKLCSSLVIDLAGLEWLDLFNSSS
ncbi:hypothetical protein WICPIJ_000786 [Wickerhamomyces pijperi]|uniref:Uncharacterized protein n=1 Tax=Wickerhamomyces pijperi TaxID=599730 RepID=A0A9P8TRH1_WICPI|nr:hypothetical protein WICPIJ_000786 [Wickerhamomyces pijperi]